uniref:DYW domain-containing protein n=1 Tax=Kalanchoe fedtschenkoi TaxID=63787 RepID=A0A7N1A0G3_KALFE
MDKLSSLNHQVTPTLLPSPFAYPQFRSYSASKFQVLATASRCAEAPQGIMLFSSSSESLRGVSVNVMIADELKEMACLDSVKLVHAQKIKMPENWGSDFMAKELITCYLRCSDFDSAAKVFFTGFSESYKRWRWFVDEFDRFGGNGYGILEVFRDLSCKGVVFDCKVLTTALRICAEFMDATLGLDIHAYSVKRGFHVDDHLQCALMNFYGRCLGLENADQLFNKRSKRSVLLWNEALSLNLQLNENPARVLQLLREMQCLSVKANGFTVLKALQACAKLGFLEAGKQVHGYVLRSLSESDSLLANSLVNMYCKSGEFRIARDIFYSMENRNLTTWNTMISGYASFGNFDEAWCLVCEMETFGIKADIVTWNSLLSGLAQNGLYEQVLLTFRKMQGLGFKPNSNSITGLLQAVGELNLSNLGRETHCYVIRHGLHQNVYVGTSLIDVYFKNNCLDSARQVFDSLDRKNIFAWNSLISRYSFKGLLDEATSLMSQMQVEGFKPDLVTWNSLVSGYSLSGHYMEAFSVIDKIKNLGMTPTVVSWTALISGCAQNENFEQSLRFFRQMQMEGLTPNSATISCILRSCAGLSLLGKGREAHCFSLRYGIENIYVATSLIDMYSKSGNLISARKIFKMTAYKTLACWNCMIMALSAYGYAEEAISHFNEMCAEGIKPNGMTFTAILSACKLSGLVDQGWEFFDRMSPDYGIAPTIEHYSCMVDLLGRAGYLDEAWDFVETMPIQPDATVWGALLVSSRLHKHLERGEIAAQKLFELEPYNSANYVVMMNLYSSLNRWEEVKKLQEVMQSLGLKNRAVWSWTQIGQTVHVFSTEEKAHPDEGDIYFELYKMVREMRKLGYVPDTSCVYQNTDEAEKETLLMGHTEKLALTYALIRTDGDGGKAVRVTKNTRICSDCHTVAKFMSLIRNREIYIRDGVRLHQIQQGRCSCRDHW